MGRNFGIAAAVLLLISAGCLSPRMRQQLERAEERVVGARMEKASLEADIERLKGRSCRRSRVG